MEALKRQVSKNRSYIAANVRYEDIRDRLRERCLTLDDDEKIMACITTREKISKCLDLLEYRGLEAYQEFIAALGGDYEFVRNNILATELNNEVQIILPNGEEEISTATMLRLSRHAENMPNWKMLARELHLEESDILEIENRNRDSLKECLYQTLLQWKSQSNVGQATNNTIYTIYQALGITLAADLFLES